jgi:4-hydroxybenzoyl-CoA thioesterase
MLTSTLRIRVEWSNCDPAGIIFNPHYYIWMDAGSHALLKAAGMDLAHAVGSAGSGPSDATKTDDKFKGYPLVTSTAQFHSPALLGDVLTLESTVAKIGNTSFETRHQFFRTEPDNTTGLLLCSGSEVRVWGSTDENNALIAVRVPDWIRENLSVDKTIDSSV